MARKLTPLHEWRRSYAEMSFIIRTAKATARGHAGHKWGDFKRPQAQRLAAIMRNSAREFMKLRPLAAKETADKWAEDARKRAIKLGHPIPNTADPDNKV